MPRHFAIEPSKGEDMYVGYCLENSIGHIKINQADGTLTEVSEIESKNKPAFIGFLA